MTERPPIACTLDTASAHGQLDRWKQLGALCTRRESRPGGVSMWFRPAALAPLRAVAAAERECCPFLTITVTAGYDAVRLDITSDEPDAAPIVELLASRAGAATGAA